MNLDTDPEKLATDLTSGMYLAMDDAGDMWVYYDVVEESPGKWTIPSYWMAW